MSICLLICVGAAFLAAGAEHDARGLQALEPWASNTHPTDLAKRHVEEATAARHEYAVVQGGTMDGENCRSPLGCGMMREGAIEQTWESNRAVRIENVGHTDVVNPWVSNGRNTFRTLDEIVASAVTPDMTDAEKAYALWWQQIRHRYHWGGSNNELTDPVKVLNIYGYNTCGHDSICMAGQWHKAGLKVAPARAVGHCISQVFYDGAWHLLDGDMHTVYLLRDNETVAGEQDIMRDHDLVKRTHCHGILQPDDRGGDEWEASLYVFEGEVTGDRNSVQDTTMNMVLRPGEALTWRWGHLPVPRLREPGKPLYPHTIANGLWEYRPDLAADEWRRGADVQGVRRLPDGLAAEEGGEGSIVWTIRSPYPFVGGRLEAEGNGVRFAFSRTGEEWQDAGQNLDSFFPPGGQSCYEYKLRCSLSAGARLAGISIVNDLQMAPRALPGMVVGENTFVYTDDTPGERNVRVTHEWVERSASRPPAAPANAVYPADGGEAEGTDVTFRWTPARDADADAIADYHFELSNRPDMRWPLSTTFRKLISRTADRGKAQYTLSEPGLLTPDRQYYWHVRAKDDKGVWGPWSDTWTFTPRGPAYPLEVSVDYDAGTGVGTLRWAPNPVGRPPAAYRVYGSDEKGFSVSDKPYPVSTGVSKELSSPFPANFIAETRDTSLAVIGSGVDLPGANKAFYRVVAVDAQGKRSGPSDYAEAPRPIIYSSPVMEATVGTPYSYQARASRSIGDLRMRLPNGQLVTSFWDIEKAKFALAQGPAWLKVDADTGLLSGTPDAPGRAEVVLSVALEREKRVLDEATLKWGNEKVIESGTETVGTATQRFAIEVRQ